MMVNNEEISLNFAEFLSKNGYYFDKKLVENFLLALKVKPFVIFTGNSGTGKTKLSQFFSKYLEGYYVEFNFSDSVFNHETLSIVKESVYEVFPIKECQNKVNISFNGISGKAKIDLVFYMEYKEESKENINKLKNYFNRFYTSDNNTILLKMDLQSLKNFVSEKEIDKSNFSHEYYIGETLKNQRQLNLGPEFFNHLPFSKSDARLIIDEQYYNVTLRPFAKLTYDKNDKLKKYFDTTKDEKVTLNIDTKNLKFDNFESKWDSLKENTYEIIPVGANWTDNTNIMGFYNSLTDTPQFTPSYNLIKMANVNKNLPYFLILDEMNLSHVERYFSDILSAIESGESIPITGSKEQLEINENLFIIGTVNIDETTYMFSPKVLDRANTIEFPTMSAEKYLLKNNEDYTFKNEKYLINPLSDIELRSKNIFDIVKELNKIKVNDEELGVKLAKELDKFQTILTDIGFDFGFRVINEILRFMLVASKYEQVEGKWDETWQRYFDAQIKQKILPKLHGSKNDLENVLDDLFNLCLKDRGNSEFAKSFDISENNCRYYESAVKIQKMSKILSRQRYVSFIN